MDLMKMTEEEKERLQSRVQNRIETISKGKDVKKNRLKVLAMAAVAGLVLLPAGGYAAGKIIDFYKQDGYQVEIAMKENQTDTVSDKSDWVKLSYELPEGYTMRKDNEDIGWYDLVWKDGWDCGKNVSFSLMQADTKEGASPLTWGNVEKVEEVTVSGNQAAYMRFVGIEGSIYDNEKENQTDYTHHLVVFYEKQGYVMEYYAMKGVSKEELIQIAGSIELMNCKKEDADGYCLLSEEYSEISREEGEPYIRPGVAENSIDAGKVHAKGETVSYDGIDYTVKNVQVLDSIAGLEKECFNDCMGIMDRKGGFCESDGTLKSYLRETVEYGDGYRRPIEKVVDSKNVSLRFVKVEMEVVNRTSDDIEYQACKALDYLRKNDKGYQLYSEYFNRPSVIRDCMLDHFAQYYEQTKGGKGFYMNTLKSGEHATYTIGFFVDEDLIADSYIAVSESILGEQQYIALK